CGHSARTAERLGYKSAKNTSTWCGSSIRNAPRLKVRDNRQPISGLLLVVSRGSGHATLRSTRPATLRSTRLEMLETECQMVESTSQRAMKVGVADVQAQMRDALARAESQIGEHWVLYLVLGLVLLIGGLGAIALPLLSTIAAKLALGWIFLFSGGMAIVHAFTAGKWQGFFLNLLIGILYVVAGGYLLLLPLAGIFTLTIVVAALF